MNDIYTRDKDDILWNPEEYSQRGLNQGETVSTNNPKYDRQQMKFKIITRKVTNNTSLDLSSRK